MHISNCQNPRMITNPATGEKVRVRCGRCSSCLSAKAKNWINRLTEEADHNRYSFMVNLSYDDSHLPRLTTDSVGNLVWYNRQLDLCIPFQELNDVLDNSDNPDREREYVESRLAHPLMIPCLCFDDIQRFNKRLNKYFHDKITGKYSNFRYFVAGEYGPATYRCHYHGEYFTNSRQVAENFSQAVSACWKNGDSSVACIYSKGGHTYVAQYVNMSCHLPAVYELQPLRQKHIFSKCPPIGSPSLLATEIRRVYDEFPTQRVVYDSQASRYTNLPVSTSFKARFFPKCEGFSRKSNLARIALYRCTEFLPSEGYDEFAEEVYSLVSLSTKSWYEPSKFERLILSFVRDLNMHSKQPDKVDTKLYKIYLVSKRFLYIRDTLRVTSGQLLRMIDNYYNKLDYERLRDFFTFQERYSLTHDPSDLIYMYPDFIEFIKSYISPGCVVDVPVYLRLAIESFGFDVNGIKSFPFVLGSLESTSDYMSMVSIHDKIYKDTHKAHDVHNYRHSERFRALNPSLQKIILKYESYGS